MYGKYNSDKYNECSHPSTSFGGMDNIFAVRADKHTSGILVLWEAGFGLLGFAQYSILLLNPRYD